MLSATSAHCRSFACARFTVAYVPTRPQVHATMLRLLGIDHTKLTWRQNGADRRLTDVHGHVIEPILA